MKKLYCRRAISSRIILSSFTNAHSLRSFGFGQTQGITLLLFCFAFLSFTNTQAQSASATWNLTATGAAQTTGNLAAAVARVGTGANTPVYATGGVSVSRMNSTTIDAADYLEFSVSPSLGYSFLLSDFSARLHVSELAAQNNARFLVRYSFSPDFSAAQDIAVTQTLSATPTVFANTGLNIAVGAGKTLYLRIFVWGLSGNAVNFIAKDLTLNGTTCPATATITYPKASFCLYETASITPTRTGAAGGTFSSAAGLVMDPATGVIDLYKSVAGMYTVTYSIAPSGGCAEVRATSTVTLKKSPEPFILTGPDGATGDFCSDGTPTTFTLSGSQAGVTYTFVSINPGGNEPPGQSFDVQGVGGTLAFVKNADGDWSYKVEGEDNTTHCVTAMIGVLKAVDKPVITRQPQAAVTVCANSATATRLEVTASGANSVRWEMSTDGGMEWTPVPLSAPYSVNTTNNATGSTLSIAAYQASMNGYQYRARWLGPAACGFVYSNTTTLTVTTAPQVTKQPEAKQVCANSTLTLSVEAEFATAYEWYKNGVRITGANGDVYTKVFDPLTDAATYYVKITGSCGTVNSANAVVTATTTTYWQGPSASATGTSGTAWELAANWSCGVPTRTKDAVIPADIIDGYPTIKSNITGEVRNLTIQGGGFGAFLVVEGTLQLFGAVTNAGVFTAENGTIEYRGSTSQNIEANTFAGNTVKNLVISNNVTLKGPLDLTGTLSFGAVNNKTFATNDHLSLKSSAAATASVADITNNGVNSGNAITGNVSVERFIPAHSNRRWRLVTAPVKGVSINGAWQESRTWSGSGAEAAGYGTLITGQQQGTAANAAAKGFDFWSAIAGGGASVRKYVGSSSVSSNIDAAFYPVDNTTTAGFSNHEAYLLFVRGDRTVSTGSTAGSALLRAKGPLKQETAYTIPVSGTQSHTLVGNPYASPINFQKLYADNSAKMQPYYWTWQAALGSGVGGYVLMLPNGEGGYEPVPAAGGSGTAQPVIGSGEGFFVVPAAGATAGNAITLKETHKDNSKPSLSIFRQAGTAPAKVRVNLFAQRNGEKTLLDGVLARFGEDEKITMAKAVNSGENLSILKGGKDLIVSGSNIPLPGDSIQLRFWNLAARAYTLELDNSRLPRDVRAVLYDRFLGTETTLAAGEGMAYAFQVTAEAGSKTPNRFVIRFKLHQVLPVKLVSFTAKEMADAVKLEWKVEEEEAVRDYTVERKGETGEFTTLFTEISRGAAGDQTYRGIDNDPLDRVAYYRLKIRERSGTLVYSDVVRVERERGVGSYSLYPNPVTGATVNLRLGAKPQGAYTLSVYSPAGQRVATQVLQHAGGAAVYPVAVHSLAAGTYLLELTGPGAQKDRLQVVVIK